MNERRQVLRVSGWIAVVGGTVATVAAIVSDAVVADFAGGYGVFFVFAGAWALVGLRIVERREHRQTVAARTAPLSRSQTETTA